MNNWIWSGIIIAVVALAYLGAGFFGHGGFRSRSAVPRPASRSPEDKPDAGGANASKTQHGCC